MLDCIKNDDCTTGFCADGTCRPPKSYGPCKYSNDKCPSGQVCSLAIDRCVFKGLKKPDGYSCTVDLDCSPNQKCQKSVCISLGGIGAHCTTAWDCRDGYTCHDSKCVRKCDPSGGSRFGCYASDTCVKGIGNVGYCAPKAPKASTDGTPSPVDKPTPPPINTSDTYSSGPSDNLVPIILSIAAVAILLITAIFAARRYMKKKAKGNQFTMQTPLPPAPPTYASPMVAPPQPMYMTNAPASPTYMASAPSQPPSYGGPPPSASPHNYPTEKR